MLNKSIVCVKVNIVSAEDLAPIGARSSADTMVTTAALIICYGHYKVHYNPWELGSEGYE